MKYLYLVFLIAVNLNLFAQVIDSLGVYKDRFTVCVIDSSAIPTYIGEDGFVKTNNFELNNLYSTHMVYDFKKSYPDINSGTNLELVYDLMIDTTSSIDTLIIQMKALNNSDSLFDCIEKLHNAIDFGYYPNDWNTSAMGANRQIMMDMKLPEAWEFVRNNKRVNKVRVAHADEFGHNISHPDLCTNIIYSNRLGSHDSHHGAKVAGAMGAISNNSIGVIGTAEDFTELIVASNPDGNPYQDQNSLELLGKLADPSQYGAKVLVITAGNCTKGNLRKFLGEMLFKGVSVVVAAGNLEGTKTAMTCDDNLLTVMYPGSLSGTIDITEGNTVIGTANLDDIIVVTGLGSRYVDNNNNLTHYDLGVDALRTFTDLQRTKLTTDFAGPWRPSTTSYGSTYAQPSGTSFSTPFVAGIVQLMYAVNPCLTPSEVHSILKATSNSNYISGFASYDISLPNAYEAVKAANDKYVLSPCSYNEPDEYVITDDQILDETVSGVNYNWEKYLDRDIIIKAGASLTIPAGEILYVSPNRKIIVERGGKLVINGGKVNADHFNGLKRNRIIMSSCFSGFPFWTGIEVHGHADQPHYSHYATQIAQGTYPVDSNDHGVVVIKNGGTIENAHVGITNVMKNNGAILTHSGGIIIAEEANFINCWKGVEMYQFRPDKAGSSTYPKQNISRFTNCTFKTTSDYFHEDYPPTDFVTLWDVHDVQFEGCTFENEAYAGFAVDERGNGITSIDATYQLKGLCTAFDPESGCATYQRNSFSHLTEGISYTASLGQPFITWIDRTDFTGNVVGVQAKGTHHDFRVTRSHFILPTSASVNNRRCAGVELLGSTGFTIEDNTFEQSATLSGNESSAGIRIAVSGQKANRIYRNTFTNITNGIWADDDNRGLQIKCNTFTTGTIHKHDVIVCGNSTRDGIAKLQGECRDNSSSFDYFSAPAGNLFSQSQGVQYSDWYNAAALPTTEYHHHYTSTSNDPLELVYKNNATNEECDAQYDETKACPLNPILDDGKGPNQQISALRSRMTEIQSELDGAPGGDFEKYLNTERELALSEVYKLFLTHDSLYGIDSARYWLEQDTSDLAKALLVALYVQEGDYTLADQALDSIADLAYTENTGKSYLDKLVTIKSTDWHYGSTDSTTLSQVAALANDSTTYGWQAYGMLASAGYLEYPVPEPPCGPGAVIGSGKRAMDTLPEAPAAKTFLTLQPNPTSGGVTLTWDTEGEQINLRVLTPQGKVVYEVQSWPGSGTRQIATPWPAGMYYIVLTDNQGKQHSTSLLLTK